MSIKLPESFSDLGRRLRGERVLRDVPLPDFAKHLREMGPKRRA